MMQGKRLGVPLQLLVSGTIVLGMLVLILALVAKSYFDYRSTLFASFQTALGNRVAVVDDDNRVVAYSDLGPVVSMDAEQQARPLSLDELGVPVLSQIARMDAREDSLGEFETDAGRWYGLKVAMGDSRDLHLLLAVPERTLLADARAQGVEQLIWSGPILLAFMLLGWAVGRLVARPLSELSDAVGALAAFDFGKPVALSSPVREINHLSDLVGRMSGAIGGFQAISRTLAREPDLDPMLLRVTEHLVHLTSADAGAVYLLDPDDGTLKRAARVRLGGLPERLSCSGSGVSELRSSVHAALNNNGDGNRVMTTPLLDREGKALGVLALRLPVDSALEDAAVRGIVDAVSGSTATAIETRHRVDTLQALIDALIRLPAYAIDAKSSYTRDHCERVPELAEMLVDAAEASTRGEFADFDMSDMARREFRIAAWLHDCGKIADPEHVVDKATKLETVYNRIHEVRTRFEVLWRDADIAYLKGVVSGEPEAELRARRARTQRELHNDFAFVAQANIGGEQMSDEDVERLRRIARRRWVRHFDKRLGLSRDEYERLVDRDEELPVIEHLLADKHEHLIPWGERRPPVERDNPDNIWGFDMALPEHADNRGELHNLSVRSGTLTEEECFAVNDHIVQTIRMLGSLPLPRDMRRVPDIAGNHHERMDGNGYPRRLKAGQLSVQERIMALADVFEALTAADRPYKDVKTLSESLRILALMVRNKHIDGELFRLFLESGTYLRYAERYLKPVQIDTVDKRQLIALAGMLQVTVDA